MVDFNSISLSLLLIVGLVLTFYGRRVLKTAAFIIGAIIGAGIGYLVGSALGDGFCIIIAVIVGALLGGYLGMVFLKGMVAMYMGAMGYMIGSAIFGGMLVPIIIGVIVFAIIYILFDKFISIVTAFFGAFLVAIAVQGLTVGYLGNSAAFILFIIIAVVLAIIGARVQLDQT
jgi:hypothetical protein